MADDMFSDYDNYMVEDFLEPTDSPPTYGPQTLEEYLHQQNETITQMAGQLSTTRNAFEHLYKYKIIGDRIVEEYFPPTDGHFRYRSALDSLDAQLAAFIEENTAEYEELVEPISVDLVLADEDQVVFADRGRVPDEEEESGTGTTKYIPLINGKLPGQHTAIPPHCPVCSLKCASRVKLEAHIGEHVDNPLIVCPYENCEETYRFKEFFTHERSYHSEIISLICELCNEGFETQSMLAEHYKFHIRKKDKLKCHLCNYQDIHEGRMDRHIQNVHGLAITKLFKCGIGSCDRIFKDRSAYNVHMLLHQDRSLVYKYRCIVPGCGKAYRERRYLRAHLERHEEAKKKRGQFVCSVVECKRTFSQQWELLEHEAECVRKGCKRTYSASSATKASVDYRKNIADNDQTEESEDEEEEEAKLDGDDDDDDDSLLLLEDDEAEGHLAQVSSGDEVILDEGTTASNDCDPCQLQFLNSQQMICHLREHHRMHTIRAYRCNFHGCFYMAHFRSTLNKHKNTVHGGHYRCEICGKLSKNSGNHIRHKKSHLQTIFRCSVEGCGAEYRTVKAFAVHLLTHDADGGSNEESRPLYSCDAPDCKYETYYAGALKTHMLIHSDVRPFTCKYTGCGKSFKRNGDLTKHITFTHLGVRRPERKKRKLSEEDDVVAYLETEELKFEEDEDGLVE